MELSNALANLNWLAIITAAFSAFVLGAVWYSPLLFVKGWLKANKFTTDDLKGKNMVFIFGLAFLLSLVMSLNLALFIGSESSFSFAITAAFLTGIGWVVPAFGIIALFENRSWTYFLINGGYLLLTFIIMGIILGAWK